MENLGESIGKLIPSESNSNIQKEEKIDDNNQIQNDLMPYNEENDENVNIQQQNEININNNNNNQILVDLSNSSNNGQNISSSEISSIPNIENSSLIGSYFNIINEIEKGEIYSEIDKKIKEGFIPFFIDLEGDKPQFIYAQKDTMFLKVLLYIQNNLKKDDILGYIYYYNNNLIDYDKTIGNLNIEPFNIIKSMK